METLEERMLDAINKNAHYKIPGNKHYVDIGEAAKACAQIAESEIEKYREALKKIAGMKKLHEKEDEKYRFNRCWNIADEALNKHTLKQRSRY